MFKKNRSILYISLTIIMIVFIASGFFVSYVLNFKEKSIASHKNGLEVTFNSSQHIELKNILPMSDELGKTLNDRSVEDGAYGFLKFSVKNRNEKNINYNIYIIKSNVDGNTINEKFVKFYLTDDQNNAIGDFSKNRIPTYPDLLSLSAKPAGRLIYSGSLDGKQEKSFVFRSWISDFYNITDDDELFGFDVFIDSK